MILFLLMTVIAVPLCAMEPDDAKAKSSDHHSQKVVSTFLDKHPELVKYIVHHLPVEHFDLEKHGSEVEMLVWPKDNLLISSSKWNKIRLWDPNMKTCGKVLQGAIRSHQSLTAQNDILVFLGLDEETSDTDLACHFSEYNLKTDSISLSNAPKYESFFLPNYACNPANGSIIRSFAYCVADNESAVSTVITSFDQQSEIKKVAIKQRVHSFVWNNQGNRCICFSPFAHETNHIIDDAGEIIQELKASNIKWACWNNAGDYIAVVKGAIDNEHGIDLYKKSNCFFCEKTVGKDIHFNVAQFHPSDKLIAAISQDSTVYLFDVKTGDNIVAVPDSLSCFKKLYRSDLAWNPTGDKLAISNDFSIRIFNLEKLLALYLNKKGISQEEMCKYFDDMSIENEALALAVQSNARRAKRSAAQVPAESTCIIS